MEPSDPPRQLVLHDFLADFDNALLVQLYESVLLPSFPRDELESVSDIRRQVLERTGIQLFAAIDPTDGPVAAFSAYWYARSRALLIGYLAVRGDRRGQGIGTWLSAEAGRAMLTRIHPALALAEVEDPQHHVRSAQFGDPTARLRLYARLGGRLLSMPYFQPRLYPESNRVYNLRLMAFGVSPEIIVTGPTGDCVSSGVLAQFLDDYFAGTEGPVSVSEDPEYLALRDTVAGLPCVPLVAVEEAIDSTSS
jgi:GNAT superfamily N-acetyltransferase